MKQEKFAKLCKDKMVNELNKLIDTNPNFVVTNYMGTSVSGLEQVRKNLKTSSSKYFVVKNSVLNVVLEKRKLDEIKPHVDGGVGISFSGNDIVATCKALANFSKANEKFKIKCAMVDGKFMAADQVKRLASLPSREILLAMVVYGIKAPITGFVNTLGGVLRKFVYCVDAVKNKKQSDAGKAQETASA